MAIWVDCYCPFYLFICPLSGFFNLYTNKQFTRKGVLFKNMLELRQQDTRRIIDSVSSVERNCTVFLCHLQKKLSRSHEHYALLQVLSFIVLFWLNFRILVNVLQSWNALFLWCFVIWLPTDREIQNDVDNGKNWSGKSRRKAQETKIRTYNWEEKRGFFFGVSKVLILTKVNLCWATPGMCVQS